MAANEHSKNNQGRPKGASQEKQGKSWVKPTLLTAIAVAIIGPIVAFMLAYVVVDVPEPEQLVTKQVSQIYASDGETEIARIVPPEGNRVEVSLSDVPDETQKAVLAAEDREFYNNSGFSITGFGRAILGQLRGDASAGGGSTITQQYVKNSLVGNDHSLVRKAKELVYSVKMANEWSKDEVLQAYLNTIYFGRNAYGIDAAAKAYFGIPASELNTAQSAVLAASIQRPSQLDPWTNREEAEARWNYVLDGMVEQGWLDPAARGTMAYPETVDPASNQPYNEADGPNGLIRNQVLAELGSLGITEDEVQTLGLRITTTIDTTAQEATVNAVENNLAGEQENTRVASVSVEPATGAVRAYYGGADAIGYDYANAPLQAGSTFKIFGLAAAVQQGIPTNAYYSSAPVTLPGGHTITNVGGESCGSCSLKQALKNSYNTSFIRMQQDLENTTQDTADMAHALGVPRSLPGIEKTLTENGEKPFDGIILGQYLVRPLDMAHALATLSNYGVYHDAYFVQKVETASGETLYEHDGGEGQRAVSEAVATQVLDAMGPIAAFSNGHALSGRPSAAKTGTTQLGDTGNNKDAWMIGSTPQLATAVWAGTDDNEPLLNAWGGPMYGSNLPADIWQSAMNGALVNDDVEYFKDPEPIGWASGGYTTGPDYSSSGPATQTQEVAPETTTSTTTPTTSNQAPSLPDLIPGLGDPEPANPEPGAPAEPAPEQPAEGAPPLLPIF
ncbi:transglycosylase domain-containing protein [Corynebacterium pelargi]|uniref:Penicillin-binding protein 1A n=1 Tax=Corynebacterium pelargi TaxID=1471400 RepID=A0A410WBS2_9CORY|nr:transglycosylase domain-containing protein [Corynebacterium pelargi]QAU53384.1 Penicillin-binding protein 1A [Corynebacterium pelargi]GGG72857.1 penicillin-binding protein [Corynebacterium pelargi]